MMSQSFVENQDVKIQRFMSPSLQKEDMLWEHHPENKIRPQKFDEFPGQKHAKENLKVYVQSAKKRNQSLDHVLLHGPPGLGKTSLAKIIANELGVNFYQTSGPAIDKTGDLAGILAGIEKNAVLFIDEIHRLSIVVEEVLYSAMEDFYIDIIVGQGPTARTVKMPINPFTLIGATTRLSLLSSPLISRFGIIERFEFYDDDSLLEIILRTASIEKLKIEVDAAKVLAQRSRGTPRIANRLLRRVRDFAEFHNVVSININIVELALSSMQIDKVGLDPLDREILATIKNKYNGGPVGIEALAHTIGEDKNTLEDIYEPFLVYKGFITRGPRGRELTPLALSHLQSLYL